MRANRILIVEDDPASRFMLTEMLDERGFDCVGVSNGKECLDRLEEDPARFDAVLMDIHMPVMSGDEAIRSIRKAQNDPPRGLRVFAITADPAWHKGTTAKDAGFDGVVSKPIDSGKIISLITNG